jgi:hypothetical protein
MNIKKILFEGMDSYKVSHKKKCKIDTNIKIKIIPRKVKTKKLTDKQQEVIDTLLKYPNTIIMISGWLTGGHGVKLDLRTVKSLESRGIIVNKKLKK